MRCPICLSHWVDDDFNILSDHLLAEQKESDPEHVMWLNHYVGRHKLDKTELTGKLTLLYKTDDLRRWVINALVSRIYGDPVHPFIERLQHPDKKTIYGYVMEHHHFLVQWVRSCASIISNTYVEEVQTYEIENISSEYLGNGEEAPSHHELLLRMGESIGLTRKEIYENDPLPATKKALEAWDRIAKEGHWLEGMAAMHTLELTANPDIKKMGANIAYFDSTILEDDNYSKEVKQFLGEGYKADSEHSMRALDLVDRYTDSLAIMHDVQSSVLKSIDSLDNYLLARLERGEKYGD